MDNVLISRARAILAQPKYGVSSKPNANAKGSTPATETKAPGPIHVPNQHCHVCGGGFWIKVTSASAWRCGGCFPSESRVETIFVPGGKMSSALSNAKDARSSPIIEPAVKPDGRPLSLVFWETGDGRILGPAVPELLAKDGGIFWIVTTFAGQILWVNTNRLRSRKAFETQTKPIEAELCR